jgi:hypothetical protein
MMCVCARRDKVEVHLSSGEVLEGEWNQAMLSKPNWWGRCVNISEAYKQVPIHKDSLVRA